MLTDKVALITGGGQGVGQGIALALAKKGAHVVVTGRTLEKCETTANMLRKRGVKALPLRCDVKSTDDLQNIIDKTIAEFGRLDILVNNAGVPIEMPTSLRQAHELDEVDYQRQLDLNYHAIRGLCMLVLPSMKAKKHGRIMITTSESHRLGFAMGLSHYAAAKSAALGYMRQLAAEVCHDGITVNALSLGTMNNFDGHERAAQSTMIGRAGTPEDVGAAALYLCSDEASWMTGQTLPLNGGACTA